MRVLDLFAGIGGFSLAAHSVGFETLAFCEIDPYCQRVLARHFPDVPIFPDVKELSRESLADAASIRRDRHQEDERGSSGAATEARGSEWLPPQQHGQSEGGCEALILTAGFPCQDISYAGNPVGYTRPEGYPLVPLELLLDREWPAGLGAQQHPWEPPRLTTEREDRASRLKALGNSIVPQVARLWFEAIASEAVQPCAPQRERGAARV